MSCSTLTVNRSIVSPTLDVNPTSFVIPCKFFGDNRFIVLQILSLSKWFFIQFSIIHDNISLQVVDKRRERFGQWMNSSIIETHIFSLIHKKCHLKSYHSETQYYMTLNTIFNAVIGSLSLRTHYPKFNEQRRMLVKKYNWTSFYLDL